MPLNRATHICAAAVLLGSIPTSAQFYKPNPIPDNYVEWTATLYGDGDGVSTYESSTETDLVFYWESGTQDVWEMYDKAAWASCDFSYATQLVTPVAAGGDYTEGVLNLKALPEGTHFLTSGVGTHCEAGQKILLTTWKEELENDETGWNAFVGAGASNLASGDWATIGGGFNNKATGTSSVVLGGISNFCVSNYATISGGYRNQAKSRFATVLGGAKNTARGRFSLAAGYMARTSADYAAAFGFTGQECLVESASTVGFCADAFYINDINILDDGVLKRRSLNEQAHVDQLASLQEISDTVDKHQETLDALSTAVDMQKRAFEALHRIEAKLEAVGV